MFGNDRDTFGFGALRASRRPVRDKPLDFAEAHRLAGGGAMEERDERSGGVARGDVRHGAAVESERVLAACEGVLFRALGDIESEREDAAGF